MPTDPDIRSGTATRPFRLAALALVLVALVCRTWLCDDAFITMRVVDNFWHGHGLTWNPPERVQVFTHPLWLLVLLLSDLLLPGDYWPAALPGLVLTALAVALACRRLAVGRVAVLALGAALALSRAFVDYGSSGLENPLGYLLVALLVFHEARQSDAAPADATLRRTMLLASLLVLTRPDLALLVAPVVGLRLRGTRRGGWRAVAVGLAPLLLWEVFALVYFGFPVPNTAYGKLGAGPPLGDLLRHGGWYLEATLRRDPLTFVGLFGGLGWLLLRGGRRQRVWAAGVGLYLLYVVMIGGDFMQGRFLAIPYFTVWLLAGPLLVTPRRAVIVAALVCGGALVPGHPLWPRDFRAETWFHGVGDERAFYGPQTGLRAHLFAGGEEHKFIVAGRRARAAAEARGGVTDVAGSIGFYGYYGGPKLRIIDTMGIADPFLARLPMAPPEAGAEWRPGHCRRDLPDGYTQTVASGVNQLANPRLARLYDDVRLVTTGPLFSPARWRAIARLNLKRD
jgi:arabinofuranosyltransferase